MDAIIVNDELEKAILVLALREFCEREFTKAATLFESGGAVEGRKSMTRGNAAKAVADRIRN